MAADVPRGGGWLNIEMQVGNAWLRSSRHDARLLGFAGRAYETHRPRHIADIAARVLAIAAAKAGCRDILASDNDPIAVAMSTANMRLNGVTPAHDLLYRGDGASRLSGKAL